MEEMTVMDSSDVTKSKNCVIQPVMYSHFVNYDHEENG